MCEPPTWESGQSCQDFLGPRPAPSNLSLPRDLTVGDLGALAPPGDGVCFQSPEPKRAGGSGVSNIFPGCGSNLSQAEAAELEVLAGVK